ncbi:hypothetical protein [Psychromonas sp. MME2]|uniref:tetratricopeptide repeat protein n=1 Tax=Psychromonas sp. MME2 TaxID=3231033 RepID=UPI00339BC7ED
MQKFTYATQAMNNNNPYNAITQLEMIPEPLLSNKVYLTTYLMASSVDEVQIKKALQLLEKYYRDDPSVSYLMAQLYLMRKQEREAIAALKTFADIIKTDAHVHLMIGHLYLAINDIDNAILHGNKALRINPREDLAYWMLAQALSRKNQPDDALLALKVLKNYFAYEFKADHFKSEKAFASLYQYEKFTTWVEQLPR